MAAPAPGRCREGCSAEGVELLDAKQGLDDPLDRPPHDVALNRAVAELVPDGRHDHALVKGQVPLGAYGPGGFYDSVAVRSGTVAERYLSLDQGMVMAAIGNELRNGAVQRYVVRGPIQRVIKPLLGIEEFNAFG